MDEIENALPEGDNKAEEGAGDDGNMDEEVYLDMDFSKTKKKKKKKAKDLDELVSEKQEDEKSDDKENGKLVSFVYGSVEAGCVQFMFFCLLYMSCRCGFEL